MTPEITIELPANPPTEVDVSVSNTTGDVENHNTAVTEVEAKLQTMVNELEQQVIVLQDRVSGNLLDLERRIADIEVKSYDVTNLKVRTSALEQQVSDCCDDVDDLWDEREPSDECENMLVVFRKKATILPVTSEPILIQDHIIEITDKTVSLKDSDREEVRRGRLATTPRGNFYVVWLSGKKRDADNLRTLDLLNLP